MRIIGGRLRGRKLHTFRGTAVRPTADRVREAIFNILAQTLDSASVLDLFAGTGALGLEAISRGAKSVVFIDNSAQSLSLIKKNIQHCNVSLCTRVIRCNLAQGLDCLTQFPRRFNLVFMDPPYGHNHVSNTLKRLAVSGCLDLGATVVAEHEPDYTPERPLSQYHMTDHRRYGQTGLSFFQFNGE